MPSVARVLWLSVPFGGYGQAELTAFLRVQCNEYFLTLQRQSLQSPSPAASQPRSLLLLHHSPGVVVQKILLRRSPIPWIQPSPKQLGQSRHDTIGHD